MFFCISTSSLIAQEYRDGIKQGSVLVKFKPQLTGVLTNLNLNNVSGTLNTGIQTLDKVNTQLEATQMKRVFPFSAKNDAKHKKHGLHLWYEITFPASVSPMEAVAKYGVVSEISLAEPIREKSFKEGEIKYAPDMKSGTVSEPFNDTYLVDQWHYNNTGALNNSVAGGDINLYNAWEIETGKSNVIVCIVDGGIDVDHEDLAANMWINEAEKNGEEGVDDDGNGYVDDMHGFNFTSNVGAISAHNHGTHVAGTVAAVNNNGIGVAGVAGGSGNGDGIRLMSAQIFSNTGAGGNSAAALVYGADNGAVISQNSWGYTSPGYVEQVILDAIDYFIAEAGYYTGSPMKGGVVIFASGNSNTELDMYPGFYDKVIAVAALGPDLIRSPYSNFGSWVDIAAPGGTEMYGLDHDVLSTLPDNKYGYMQGTSMACPHVSGVAALVVSKFGGSTFTNEDLKLQILTGTRDVDVLNPDYTGKLGIGYMDASWALDTNEEIAPDPITDLTLLGTAQDFANITWSVPADEDDGKSVSYEVLYSSEEITDENATTAKKVAGPIGRNDEIGFLMEMEVLDLLPETMYYFAVRTLDRWGNVSLISNVVTGTTNAGPAIATDPTSLSFTIDATISTLADGMFTILNEAEGVLKWNGSIRHKKPSLSYNSSSLNYPTVNMSSNPSPSIQVGPMSEANGLKEATGTFASISPMAEETVELFYGTGSNPYPIGETDISFTNSSATRFYVDMAEGFNLTEVESFLKHAPLTGNMIMEIYQGEEMTDKNLALAQEVSSYDAAGYWHMVYLDEQLFFEQGTTFWIVFHVPANNVFPLGIEQETQPEYSDNCFMSLDMGATWDHLGGLISMDDAVWSVAAISKNRHLGNFITLSPSSGVVEGNSSQEIALNVDATTLINGNYSANVFIASNDGDDQQYRIPVSVAVSGQIPVLDNASVIEFGNVFDGLSKEMTFTVQNTGLGNFNVSSVVSSDPRFEIIKKPWKIKAKDAQDITIKYVPNGVGTDNGNLKLTDSNGNVHTIYLFGVAIAPSEIVITPAEQQLPAMGVNETASTSFSIVNNGNYPLEYVIPAFAPEVQLEGMDAIHKSGYTIESNSNGNTSATFAWEDMSNATDVTAQMARTDYAYRYLDVDLGFEFPFYGQTQTSVKLTRLGVLAFSEEGGLGNCSPTEIRNGCVPEGFISAFSKKFDLNRSGSLKYKRGPGMFIVEYKDVLLDYEWNPNAKTTFQIVLFYNGDIEIRFKDVENFSSYQLQSALVAIGDHELEDSLMAHGYKGSFQYKDGGLTSNETIFRFKSPGQSLITSVSEAHGVVNVGETKLIDVDINTAGLYESETYQRLSVVSNDPFNNPTAFTVKVNVNSGGVAAVEVDKTAISLGPVFEGGSARDVVIVSNNGSKDISVTSVIVDNVKFEIEGEVPTVLKPKSTFYIPVEINTSEVGVYDGDLTIGTSDGAFYTVALHADVIPAPSIAIDVTSFVETLAAGEMIGKTITVTNNGASDLEVIPAGNDWLYSVEKTGNATELPQFSYYSQTSDDVDGPVYSWDDIRKTGMHFESESWADGQDPVLWQRVDLPYELSFYNQKTSSIWVSWQGLIALSEPTVNEVMLWPSPIPSQEEPNNFIAPYFAQQNTDINSYGEEAGTFYKIYDDRVVIMWAEQYDGFGMGDNYNFEAIIYKNGNIKFQYKTGSMSMTSFGAVGIENANGTEGVQLAYMQNFIKNGLAVSFTPAEKEVIVAGASKEFNIAIDAALLNKGVYEGNFKFFNNTPANEEVKVPVTLTVTGEAELIASTESFDFGNIVAYTFNGDYGPEVKSYIQEFTLENPGKDGITFTDIHMESGLEAAAEIFYYDPWMGFGSWQAVNSWNVTSLVPGESIKLRMRIFPSGDNAELVDAFVIEGNAGEIALTIPVMATVSLPAAIGVDVSEIKVIANTPEHTETRTVVIDNLEGEDVLNYEIGINYSAATSTTNAAPTVMSKVSTELLSAGNLKSVNSTAIAQPFSNEEYNAVLEYDTATEAFNILGFGPTQAFTGATQFVAPIDGFNLTHVQTWYRYNDVLDSKVTVEIRTGGTGIDDATVLTRETFTVTRDTENADGEYITFELSENQILYPGQSFYVVFEFELGVEYPQGLSDGHTDVENRFMYTDGYNWGDLQQIGFSGQGWMMKALEKEHKSNIWVSIDGDLEGTIPAGESRTISLNFDANNTEEKEVSAFLVINSNDPYNSEENVGLSLIINQAPEFVVNSNPISVIENEVLTHTIVAVDPESDEFTYALKESYEAVSSELTEEGFVLTYAADYDAAGTHVFVIVATDAHGNTSENNLEVTVINSNRAPYLVSPLEAQVLYLDGDDLEIELNDVFKDADGEVLNFEFSSTGDNVGMYASDDVLVLKGELKGEVILHLKAVDAEGLMAETSFAVQVMLETLSKDYDKVFPTITTGLLNIQLARDFFGDVDIFVFDIKGALKYQTKKNILSQRGDMREQIDISPLSPGMYIIKISSSEATESFKIIKK